MHCLYLRASLDMAESTWVFLRQHRSFCREKERFGLPEAEFGFACVQYRLLSR